MKGAVIEQAEVKHLMSRVREGDEYVFMGGELECCTCWR